MMPRPSGCAPALAALALASACAAPPGTQDGPPRAGATQRGAVCLVPRDHAARLANPHPLRDGGWVACLAYRAGAIDADAYRALLAERVDAALLHHAADRLAALGSDAGACQATAERFTVRLAAAAAALPDADAAPPRPSLWRRLLGLVS